MSKQSRTIDAVRVTCSIIDLLQDRGEAGITEIAEELDRSKSSVHAYLATLVDEKYVVKRDGRYSLSLRYLDLAEHVKNQAGKYEVIRSEIDKLAQITDEVAQFATLEQGDLVYLYKARGDSAVETMSSIGSREALHSTSLGKAILSQLDESRVRDLVGPGPLARKTENTITDVDAFFEELRRIRERGYAVDDEENIVGLRCISAPVVLDDGTVLGAISVTGPSSRMTVDRIENELEDSVKRAANVVQINTKFSDGGSTVRAVNRGVISDFESAGSATASSAGNRGPIDVKGDSGSDREGDAVTDDGGAGRTHEERAGRTHEERAALTDEGRDVVTDRSELTEREWCQIQPVHSGKSLDVHAGSTADGTQVQQYHWHDAEMQKFEVTRLDDGTFRIDAAHSGKPLEVEDASTFDGANVQQNTWSGADHQRWRIERVGDGEFRVVNVNSERVLDVAGQSTDDGAAIVQWSWHGGDNQRFRF